MILKVISGGQSGADIAGLQAAMACGIETGGWMPAGFLTEYGPRPNIGKKYGLQETRSKSYPPRTAANVNESDGTIRFAADFTTAGEKLTLHLCEELGKPHFDVNARLITDMPYDATIAWIKTHNIQTLNIAGNRETTFPGIEIIVRNRLIRLFNMINKR